MALKPGLASSAFAFCWRSGLAWLPLCLCEELSPEAGTAEKKNERNDGVAGIKSPLFSTSHASLLTWIHKFKDGDRGLRTPKGKGSLGVRYCIVSCELQIEARADVQAPRTRVRARAEGASQNSRVPWRLQGIRGDK